MILEYKIDENDFLTHQLFIASKSDRIKKKRVKNKIIIPIIYFVLGVYFLVKNENLVVFILFSLVGFLWYFFYPIWERKHYINHYKGFIKENYNGKVNIMTTIEFNNELIIAKDQASESKVFTTEISEIVEIPSTIYVRLKSGQSIILPKDKIANFSQLRARLKELAKYLNINYELDEKWEWR